MQVVIWIIIILVVVFLIWLLRKWIKRIIFIAILLALAFFIYGIFSPSGASRLWYNVRTFPQRITSWFSSQTFLDYDSYKLDISSVGVKEGSDSDTSDITSIVEDENDKGSDVEVKNEVKKDSKKDNKVDVEPVVDKQTKKTDSKNKGYSSADVLTVINKYVKDNLDDDTDILVTIEFDDKDSPEKIVLKTQDRSGDLHYVSIPRLSVKKVSNGLQRSKTSVVTVVSGSDKSSKNEVKTIEDAVEKTIYKGTTQSQPTVKQAETKSYNGLTQSEMREAEQVFSILF